MRHQSQTGGSRWGYPLLARLHFYAGLLVGPFIFIAALSGALFALTPQIESWLYQSELTTDHRGEHRPLSDQIQAARQAIGEDATLAAVRPAPAPGQTTRVMFAVADLKPSEHQAIFVDPATLNIQGSLVVYGTSGTLPFRIWIDYLHRQLHLGEIGRYYSELAASWLWLVALGGVALWWRRRRQNSNESPNESPNESSAKSYNAKPETKRAQIRRWHSTTGVVLCIALLFFSVTGLTWSKWAGGNIATLRTQLDWGTPSLNTRLSPGDHSHQAAHHHGDSAAGSQPARQPDRPELYDSILSEARRAGIDSSVLEIKPATNASSAWVVREIDRSWPTQVDTVAIDPRTLKVTDQLAFEDFPIAAKLTRWGIDAHMGILFGLPNQLFVAACGLALCGVIVLGYRMWWLRRPVRSERQARDPRRIGTHLRRTPPVALLIMAALAVALGVFAPVMGVSLLAFLLIDALLGFRSGKRAGLAENRM